MAQSVKCLTSKFWARVRIPARNPCPPGSEKELTVRGPIQPNPVQRFSNRFARMFFPLTVLPAWVILSNIYIWSGGKWLFAVSFALQRYLSDSKVVWDGREGARVDILPRVDRKRKHLGNREEEGRWRQPLLQNKSQRIFSL